MTPQNTFETTYPRYDFSELVRLSLALAGFFKRFRATESAQRHDAGSHAHA